MHVAPCSNASAETTGDFVVTQINMRAATRANCRSRGATDLLFPVTFKTLVDRTALSLPKILESAEDGVALLRWRFFPCPQLQVRFVPERSKGSPARAADCAFGRHIFLPLEPAL